MDNVQKVLVIEDNPTNLELTCDLLELAGFQVLKAETAKVGIELAKEEQPHLILMDIQLPEMDGITAYNLLRKNDKTNHIPVVALTAHVMPGDKEEIMKAGFNGYIVKPISTRSFANEVQSYIK